MLPEPIIPHAQYRDFVQPMQKHQQTQAQDLSEQEILEAQSVLVPDYQRMVKELPPLNRQLLLYLLDTLAVFASRSEKNKMTAQRLVMCFQPALISAEPEKMDEYEHKLAADVATFLVEYQDDFLIGMSAPAATTSSTEETSQTVSPTAQQSLSQTEAQAPESNGVASKRQDEADGQVEGTSTSQERRRFSFELS